MSHKVDDSVSLKRNSGLVLNMSPSSGMHKQVNPLVDRKMFQGCHELVFSDSTSHLNRDLFHFGGNSPPPPALSPASSSPDHLTSNTQTRVSSPSPPVIDAEITENSSESSRVVYDKEMCMLGSTEPEMSAYCHQTTTSPYSCLSIKPHPRLPASTSSSSSTTSASSSTATATGSTEHLKNSLPILEKISIVMGSPGGSCGQPLPLIRPDDVGLSFSQQDQLETQASVTLIPIDVQSGNAAKLGGSGDQPPCPDGNLLPTATPTVDKTRGVGSTRGRGRSGAGSRRSIKSRQKSFAFSDDDVEDSVRTKVSRGKAGVSAVLRRVKQNAGHKRNQSVGGPLESGSTNPDAVVARRYLESPFLCLCQSGSNSSELNTAYGAFSQHRSSCSSATVPANTTAPESGSNSISDFSSTRHLPAHLISPALLHGQAVSAAGSGGQLSVNHPCTFPPTCPFTPKGHQSRFGEHDHFTSQGHSDSKNIFMGLTYRPSLATRLLSSAALDNQTFWCCAFCGESSSMSVELGSIYGPYWLNSNEVCQLPPHLVTAVNNPAGDSISSRSPTVVGCRSPATQSQSPNSSSRVSAGSNSVRAPAVGAGGRCQNVTRSNSRRSSPAANNSTTTIPAVGSLRLVIKAPNTKRPKTVAVSQLPSSRQQSVKTSLTRVGVNGEVWLHLECALWAPGTYLLGNGSIGGLGEALQLALDATCSHCDNPGAVVSCCYRGCNLSYHYQCSFKAGCHLDQDRYTLVCRKHHIYS